MQLSNPLISSNFFNAWLLGLEHVFLGAATIKKTHPKVLDKHEHTYFEMGNKQHSPWRGKRKIPDKDPARKQID